jgi:hypothetical protein
MLNQMATFFPDLLYRICRGKQFLLSRQNETGFWQDYLLPPGVSEAWTTSVVGWALSQPPIIPGTVPALHNATNALHRCGKSKGWSYNTRTAVDADSTAWTLRLLVLLDDLRGIDPIGCLTGFINRNHSIRTFQDPIRFGTWAETHHDVMPLIGTVLLECGGNSALITNLRNTCLAGRRHNKLWKAFWWTTDSYAINRNLEFLEASGGIPKEIYNLSRDWLISKPKPQSAFEAAQDLMVSITLSLDIPTYAHILLEFQQEEGNWPSSNVLIVPGQRLRPRRSKNTYADIHSLMTTAMATIALCQLAMTGLY